ncbi:hypothetical protein [Candidatus Lokiarchaeum ossiferum]|uniref:hypothetical protein n=1 Tax=Candidatus Lokiarchaeum ossiferum TaxID=2951803 RepID=UPI00352C3FF9
MAIKENSNEKSEKDSEKTRLIRNSPDAELDKDALKRLQQIHVDNIEEIDRMEQTLGQKIKVNRVEILLKLGVYIIQTLLLIWITSPIQSIFWSIFISIIGAFCLSLLSQFIINKIKQRRNKDVSADKAVKEVRFDTQRALVQAVVSQFSTFPPLLKDNVASLCYKGGAVKVSSSVRKMRNVKSLLEDFLQARKDFRDMKYNDAHSSLVKITQKTKNSKNLASLYREANLLLEVIPVLNESS